MRQASELQLSHEKTLRVLAEMTLALKPASVSWPPPPSYICEWLSSPYITAVRAISHGETRWLPNRPLQDTFVQAGLGAQLAAMSSPQAISAAARQSGGAAAQQASGADAGGAEASLTLDNLWMQMFSPAELKNVLVMLASMWASVDPESRQLTLRELSAAHPMYTCVAGVYYGPFQLSFRLALLPGGTVGWEAFHFVPWVQQAPVGRLPPFAMVPCGGRQIDAGLAAGYASADARAWPMLPMVDQLQLSSGACSSGSGRERNGFWQGGLHDSQRQQRGEPRHALCAQAEVAGEAISHDVALHGLVDSLHAHLNPVDIEELLSLC